MRCLSFVGAVVLAACSTPLAAQGTTLASGTGPEVPWLRILLSLVLCIGLAGGAIVALRHFKRYGLNSGGGNLMARLRAGPLAGSPGFTVIEARRLSPSSQLCLVEFDGRHMLLGVAEGSISVLAERDAVSENVADEAMR